MAHSHLLWVEVTPPPPPPETEVYNFITSLFESICGSHLILQVMAMHGKYSSLGGLITMAAEVRFITLPFEGK